MLSIEELLNIFLLDKARIANRLPEFAAQFFIRVAVSAAVVVVLDLKALEISLVLFARLSDHLFFRAAFFASSDHNRGAMRVVGPHKHTAVPAQLLKADPDVGLNVFDQMAKVDRAVCVGQGGGHQDFSFCHFVYLSIKIEWVIVITSQAGRKIRAVLKRVGADRVFLTDWVITKVPRTILEHFDRERRVLTDDV